MDPFTHTFVGLAAAKAGLERMSPLATTVCVLAANSPDSDIVVGLTTARWNYLHHHRGITHSIVGAIALAVVVPSLVWAAERVWAKWRRRQPRRSEEHTSELQSPTNLVCRLLLEKKKKKVNTKTKEGTKKEVNDIRTRTTPR